MRGEGRRDEVDALVERAAESFETEEFEAALARAEEALAREPRTVPALHYRAASLAALGRVEEAAAAYDRALALGRDDLDLLLGAADFFAGVDGGDEPDREPLERAIELSRRGAKLAGKAGDRELAVEFGTLEAVALNQLGRNAEALARLDPIAASAPDRADVRLERGFALYELCRFDDAQEELVRAEALDPDDAWTQHTLGLVAERRGDRDEARRRFGRARKLAPDEFPRPIALPHDAFDEAVEAALEELPESVRRYLSNVAITVEELPSNDDLLASEPPLSPSILGLFRGAPYGQKASMDPWSHFPSAIVLYQRNLERFARSRKELVEQIGITLIHEVGHFLGLDEEELWARGLD